MNDKATTGLLFLSHRIPWPPNKGDKIRSYHELQFLARRYDIYLGTFVDDAQDWRYTEEVAGLCRDAHFAALTPERARWRSLKGLVKGEALTLPYYRDAGLAQWVNGVLGAGRVQRVLAFSAAMAQYVLGPQGDGIRKVIDMVDIDSDKWAQYGRRKAWPQSWLYAHEARMLSRYEIEVARRADASVFVSAAEAALFKRRVPEAVDRITHVCNGVDMDYFSPDRPYENPYPEGRRPLVFTGAMDYWPNIDAVTWFAREVLAQITRRHPAAWFYIVGSRPTPAVTALAALPNVAVTGTVDDVRPYAAHAHVVVAPLRVARGVQNKVLEAMAMARPVVATTMAMAGIEDVGGVMCADDAAATAARIAAVLDQAPGRPGSVAASRECVMGHYDWDRNLQYLSDVLEVGHESRDVA